MSLFIGYRENIGESWSSMTIIATAPASSAIKDLDVNEHSLKIGMTLNNWSSRFHLPTLDQHDIIFYLSMVVQTAATFQWFCRNQINAFPNLILSMEMVNGALYCQNSRHAVSDQLFEQLTIDENQQLTVLQARLLTNSAPSPLPDRLWNV